MRQVMRKGLITAAAASGVLAVTSGGAYATDLHAHGGAENSGGVLSGNSVQAPVNVPVNVCGNTVDVVGAMNPVFGNKCANVSDGGHSDAKPGNPGGQGEHSESGNYGGGASAGAHTSDSPGIGSGNQVQVPVQVPVNVCGNSVTVGGLSNLAVGNECANASDDNWTPPEQEYEPEKPVKPGSEQPNEPGNPGAPEGPSTQTVIQPGATEALAQTGSAPLELLVPLGAGMLLAGTVMYRRARVRASA
jgi:hypothetical protein